MGDVNLRWWPVIWIASGWVVAGCGDDERPQPIDDGHICVGGVCGDAEVPIDGGDADAPIDGGDAEVPIDGGDADAEPDAFTTGTAYGTVFAMEPPAFSPFKGQSPSLESPATVSIYARGTRWNAAYDPVDGFRLEDVPAGDWTILVEDVDDANGVMPSLIGGVVPENAEVKWEVPVTKRASLEDIYGGLSTPQEIDPTRAQLLVTVVECALLGGAPRSGLTVTAPTASDGIVYDAAGGSWSLNAIEGTGALGVAIVVNAPANEYPGSLMTLSWKSGTETGTMTEFRAIPGAVTRIYYSLPCEGSP